MITECSLPQVLYYNENYADNICDIAKTHKQIMLWYKQHDNINVFVERGDHKYVHTGRFQDEEQAKAIDRGLRAILARQGLRYTALPPNLDDINAFAATLVE